MTFSTEEVRSRFHSLPTQTQFEWSEYENDLAAQGRTLHIEDVNINDESLEVSVRINEQLK